MLDFSSIQGSGSILLAMLFDDCPGEVTLRYHGDGIQGDLKTNCRTTDGNVFRYEQRFDFIHGLAYLDWLVMEDGWGCGGLAKTLMRNALRVYPLLGVLELRMKANIEVGGYAWARYGFLPTMTSWRRLRRQIRRKLTSLPPLAPDERVFFDTVLRGPPTGLWAVAASSLGHQLLDDACWDGVFRFDDPAQMHVMTAYLEKR